MKIMCWYILYIIVCIMMFQLETKRVYVNMVADLFHYGHVNFLRQAAQLGDELVVGIVSDDLLASYKRVPIIKQYGRVEVVKACRYVSEVISGTPVVIDEAFMKEHAIDLVVHGSDFTEEKMKYYFPYAYAINAVVIVPYTVGISTTNIIKEIKERSDLVIRDGIRNDIQDWL